MIGDIGDNLGGNTPEIDGGDIAKEFAEAKRDDINAAKGSLLEREKTSKDLGGESGTKPGWEKVPDLMETERYTNDVFIKEQKDRIRRMEDAIKVLEGRPNIIGENGEVSSRKFGDIIWGYTIRFPGDDGADVEEKLNIMLVPSALVGNGEFETERDGKKTKFTIVSPNSEIGKRIVNASI